MLAVAGAAALTGSGHDLRVCADPNNLPFSNDRGEGFENKIASLFAHDLNAPLRYYWLPQSRGFVRKTLNTGACDVIMGVPDQYDPVLTTKPYYRSSYVFVYRADRGWNLSSLDDPLLMRTKIGIHLVGDDNANPPAAQALAARGIIDNVIGYPMIGDYGQPNPPARLIHAVARGDVDVAIVWGPLAGYFAPRESARLTFVPVTPNPDPSGMRFTFAIAMGVRHNDRPLAATLDALIDREQPAIERILDQYGVPRTMESAPCERTMC